MTASKDEFKCQFCRPFYNGDLLPTKMEEKRMHIGQLSRGAIFECQKDTKRLPKRRQKSWNYLWRQKDGKVRDTCIAAIGKHLIIFSWLPRLLVGCSDLLASPPHPYQPRSDRCVELRGIVGGWHHRSGFPTSLAPMGRCPALQGIHHWRLSKSPPDIFKTYCVYPLQKQVLYYVLCWFQTWVIHEPNGNTRRLLNNFVNSWSTVLK